MNPKHSKMPFPTLANTLLLIFTVSNDFTAFLKGFAIFNTTKFFSLLGRV